MRYRFVKDDDCHWYLIPEEMGEDDCYAEFCNVFDTYRCNCPSDYTFENPQ